MAFSLNAFESNTNQNNATCSLTAVSVSAGDLIIAAAAIINSATCAISDTIGNTYTALTKQTDGSSFGAIQFFWAISSGSNASNVVKTTITGSNTFNALAGWFITPSSTPSHSGEGLGNGSGANPTVGSFSPTGSTLFIATAMMNENGVTPSAATPAGYTLDVGGVGNAKLTAGHNTFSSSQSGITPGFTATSSSYAIAAEAFSVSGAPPPSGSNVVVFFME